MAENKKSFVLYADLISNIDHLTNEEKGILFNHLLEYVNDMNPILEDRLILTAWKPIERQLKRDLQKYEGTKEERSKSGILGNLKRYHLDLYKEVKSGKITIERAQSIATSRKDSHSDTKLAVNDNDNVNDNVIIKRAEENLIEDIFKKVSINYTTYAKQLLSDAGYIEALSMNQIKDTNKDVCKNTTHKYLKLFLSHLNEYKHVHNNKKEFSANFSNWLRKQTIVKVYPKQDEIRYF
jgi:hypothetical protein